MITEKKGEGERGKNFGMLFDASTHSLVDSCVCPDWGWNLQPWSTGTMLQPTEPFSQGSFNFK